MNRSEILAAAEKCVNGNRQQDYGTPERSFDTIASLWNAYLSGTGFSILAIKPDDVAAMLALLKIARIATGHGKDDNWIDLAGYAACGGEIQSMRCPPAVVTVTATQTADDSQESNSAAFLVDQIDKLKKALYAKSAECEQLLRDLNSACVLPSDYDAICTFCKHKNKDATEHPCVTCATFGDESESAFEWRGVQPND